MTLALSLGLWCSSQLFASAPDRRNWIFEQLSFSPIPTQRELGRYQLSLGAVNYVDSTSVQATGQFDLRFFEVRLRGSQRFFLGATSRGIAQKNLLDGERSTFGFEIARQYVTPSKHYARLGVEGLYFLPSPIWSLRVGVDTGILESASSPWALNLHASAFLETPGKAAVVQLRGQVTHALSQSAASTWKLGMALGFSQRMAHAVAAGSYEWVLMSLGPTLEHAGLSGHFRLTVPFRLWVDRTILPTGVATFPLELSPPDIQLSWTLVL